jgi:hypothetical protein
MSAAADRGQPSKAHCLLIKAVLFGNVLPEKEVKGLAAAKVVINTGEFAFDPQF